MELLFSNFPPLNTAHKKFYDQFYDDFNSSDNVNIAVAYITADSIAELKHAIELNSGKHRYVNLAIGMHYFEQFTKPEYDAVMNLHEMLSKEKIGSVKLANAFKFHGKLYSYSNQNKVFSTIIGSDNLSSIVKSKNRVYEASVRLTDPTINMQLNEFIVEFMNKSCKEVDQLDITNFRKIHNLFENLENVESVPSSKLTEHLANLTNQTFKIPLKAGSKHAKSNLNVFFGKGRQGKNNLIKPRHWYEVELIVPSEITRQSGYPSKNFNTDEFDVITDDGWKFRCKVSGDYNKNFRSENDLTILGKWIKGRLENSGALRVGELVTDEVLNKYGRSDFELTKTKTPNLWYLNFKGNCE